MPKKKPGKKTPVKFDIASSVPLVPGNRDLYLAGYDIAHPRRLHAALKLVRGHATGGQKSVYEVHLTNSERASLCLAMRGVMDPEEDRFFLLKLDRRAPVFTLGTAVAPSSARYFIVS